MPAHIYGLKTLFTAGHFQEAANNSFLWHYTYLHITPMCLEGFDPFCLFQLHYVRLDGKCRVIFLKYPHCILCGTFLFSDVITKLPTHTLVYE